MMMWWQQLHGNANWMAAMAYFGGRMNMVHMIYDVMVHGKTGSWFGPWQGSKMYARILETSEAMSVFAESQKKGRTQLSRIVLIQKRRDHLECLL